MMTTSRGGTAPATSSQPSQDEQQECCMCGDFGLSSELFRCKICQFRSQHRYCSNIYPKAESYRVCNWCLNGKEDTAEKTQNSLNSSSSNKNATNDQDDVIKTKKKSTLGNGNNNLQRSTSSIKIEKGGSLKLNVNNHSIKKQKSPERSPLLAARKRITTSSAIQESMRRTKSEEISNSGMKRHVSKNRVRRYKLLDEVSS